MLAGCSRKVDHLSYDEDGVAEDVMALVPFNDAWARERQEDAVLYRIELRSDPPSDSAPPNALYSYYSPGSHTFMTATSDPKLPWAGDEAQDWPVGRPEPLPLPSAPLDFKAAWTKAVAAGVSRVSSAVLEVNQRNSMPIVAWTITGQLPDIRDPAVYIDALTGERLNPPSLLEPPMSPAPVERAISAYRGALRGDVAEVVGCEGKAIPVPIRQPVLCFDVLQRAYLPIAK